MITGLAKEQLNYEMDYGEPSCWACGIWMDEIMEDHKNPEIKDVFDIWNYHSYLDRCHIIPAALGGCNCAANLVLLCKACHKDNPDTVSAEMYLQWVRNRKNWIYLLEVDYLRTLEDFGLAFSAIDFQQFNNKTFRKYFFENTVKVGGKYSRATIIASLMSFLGKG